MQSRESLPVCIMKFIIPFSSGNITSLKNKASKFLPLFKHSKDSKLAKDLEKADAGISREEYLSVSVKSFVVSFVIIIVLSLPTLYVLKINYYYLISLGIAVVSSSFILFSKLVYPSVYVSRKQKEIEKNLLSALRDIGIQLNSGIPLFSIMVNISSSNYGELSLEFKKIVKRINAGEAEVKVLDDIGAKNPSVFFRRALWQISNGMRAGSDMEAVIKDSIRALNDEQMIQLQSYGNKLNPLVVFYMLISVIIPALSITFMTILASMLNISKSMTILLFLGLFVFVVIAQIMFLGLIKSRRPSLL